ncbi:acyl-phosphate glycerol-3-phosphate acyltransferase [Schinkia azotoformans MEV2011]|uniref:Glycerol-3-phosphate acyltransferase n=1 Tax=Schinkia azotoformans MEV2011 TaxID=1348973 RepID=A0A072NJP3_SCHAZ|nr:glycerol-3-phosphate 1-O-acyltransferase PlsY [Schinkia azotoformans]KEF37676.1 acyl-phosphate glycerol-3-phosphate acyltransferase [Schinkia azotoformans MEV2011]MEC1697940.1 glycerol-3-phosphate 1-O-acyltransferase PlsY [Schinkia azotoformans]MEC1717125.1 glycerol-3-phosphate 1-O-acyltransferase PlsY [Schinkia azotoformans]MEC1725168.1 glycerol-3-phosphate 1-O-acyltransferase PlsY [Schinkia azotoformans]MEC1741939.1 glycerol-3-phosphate 1-O-acyltransferase PlsY [Schinkia azotoformans]
MTVLLVVLAYLLGSIPFALIVGKIGYGIDIREHGSGNLGGTNTFRVLGKKAGLIVTSADILKGTLAASLPLIFGLEDLLHPLLIGIAAVIGHTYPIFAKFKGGKAVATSAGVLLAYSPLLFIILILSFFVSLYFSKYVSLSSMIAGIIGIIYSLFTGDIPLIIVISLLASFVIYRHRSNISRIIKGTEPKIKWMSKKKSS